MLVYQAETSLPSVEAAVATTRTMPAHPCGQEAGTIVGSKQGK